MCRGETHELLTRAFQFGLRFWHIAFFVRLSRVEPAANAESLPTVLRLSHDNLLN